MSSTLAALATVDHGEHGVQHFALGPGIPILSYVVSVIGSSVGLACAVQARRADDAVRDRWLLLAAIAIGGVAIWLMHFIAMLGMRVPGSPVRFSLTWTALSALLSVSATFVALKILGRQVRLPRLLLGGLVMGLAVNVMHYVGMHAVRVQADVSYDRLLVAASVLIAVVAATVALWFTLVLRTAFARLLAGFVMGVAVVGMHFTGMAAMRVRLDSTAAAPEGLEVFTFLFPVFVVGLLGLGIPIAAVMLAAGRDAETDAALLEDDAEDGAEDSPALIG
jgi:NO-binding membrane sensor protein with MHYT domain